MSDDFVPGDQTQKDGISPGVAFRLLAIREALIRGSIDDAFHELYALADNSFESLTPWIELEGIAAGKKPSVAEPNEVMQPPVSKEVSQSDEEIARKFNLLLWEKLDQFHVDLRHDETLEFFLTAIRAKQVSESADTARLEAVLSELIESSALITVWTGTDPLKAERFFNARNKAISAMSAKG